MAVAAPRALLITGTVGAAKTTTATAIGDVLGESGVSHAVVDLDWLRRSWPTPHDDPSNLALELQNLRAVASNFVQAGAERLVLAGVLESEEVRGLYEHAVDLPLVVCRLQVQLDRVDDRLRQRHPPGPELDWHLARSGELEQVLRTAAIGDHVVLVAEHSPEEVAREVLAAVGWL